MSNLKYKTPGPWDDEPDEGGNKVTATLRLVAEYGDEREDPIAMTVQLGRVQS